MIEIPFPVNRVSTGDALELLEQMPDESINCVVTSPPYFRQRDYKVDGQLGQESTPHEYIENLVRIFRLIWQKLHPDGTVWVNLGDSYAGSGFGGGGKMQDSNKGTVNMQGRGTLGLKNKDLIGIPWRFAFAMQDAGWWLRQDIIWSKPKAMPESVLDRCTRAHEYIFMFTKSAHYFYNAEAIRTPPATSSVSRLSQNLFAQVGSDRAHGVKNMKAVGRSDKQRGHSRRHEGFNARWDLMSKSEQLSMGANRRSVWTMANNGYKGAHFATYPLELPSLCVQAGSKPGQLVFDPFSGSGTTGIAAIMHGRQFVGFELNPEYTALAHKRMYNELGILF